LGTGIYFFAAYKSVSLLLRHYALKTLASSSVHSFPIWPFAFLYVIGSFLLSFALFWSLIRAFVAPGKTGRETQGDQERTAEEEWRV
jgi:hypothetical protein